MIPTSSSVPEPLVQHENLGTTFVGVVHLLSTVDAPVHQYRGIKYASVPARFRQSKLFHSYHSITDATRYGPICPQSHSMGAEQELFGISEDVIPKQTLKQNEFECLNLNITRPANIKPGSRLPVMLWVHGGGNRGSGSSWMFDGGALVQASIHIGKPVIVVTFNYRLGLFGFAASVALRDDNKAAGDEGVGNYGLRDQRKALEWVNRFISSFSGDPSNITIFGESTGAADILCHMHSVANDTHPLFARAIVQSAIIEHDVPNVAQAGAQLSRSSCMLRAHTVEELRAVEPGKLIDLGQDLRAVDDGVFFCKGWREALYPEAHREHTPRHLSEEHLGDFTLPHSHFLHVPYTHHTRARSRSRSRPRTPQPPHHAHVCQPLIIGDCAAESLLWSLPASLWTAPGVERRVRAIVHSLSKSNALLRAYDISAYTPEDELPEHVLDLINDARFAWPTECVVQSSKRARGGHGVWRYVFDQEGPARGVPHHAVDLAYLFDNVPLPASCSTSTSTLPPDAESSPPDLFFGSDSDEEDSSSLGSSDSYADGWSVAMVDAWTYARVRDAIQGRWLAFAWGEDPWSEEKVYVFGPEGEVGERSAKVFEGRRRKEVWKEVLEPLGMQLVQKVGVELCNGPPMSSKARF